jgi:hypothetical protein
MPLMLGRAARQAGDFEPFDHCLVGRAAQIVHEARGAKPVIRE